jgi:hypothetical protein
MVVDVVLLRVWITLASISLNHLAVQVNVLAHPCTAAISAQALRNLEQRYLSLLMPSILS